MRPAWPVPALVLTAGLGTRLRPLTDRLAKPALPVGDEALVCRVLRHLAAQGIRDVILNLHHLPQTVARVVGDGSDLGLRVRYSWEQPRLLGSAGGIRHALPLIDGDTLLVVNGDTLCDLPLRALVEYHVEANALATLGLMPHPAPAKYRGVVVAPDGAVTGFCGPDAWATSAHYPGIQVVQREVYASLPANEPAEYIKELYPRLIAEQPGRVRGLVAPATFRDIGTVADYVETCVVLAGDHAGNVIAREAHVDAAAHLTRTVVWPGGRVGADCHLDGCVVTDAASVAAGTTASGQVFL